MSLDDDPSDFDGVLPVIPIDSPPVYKDRTSNAATGASAAGARAFAAQTIAFYFRAPVKAFFRTRVDYLVRRPPRGGAEEFVSDRYASILGIRQINIAGHTNRPLLLAEHDAGPAGPCNPQLWLALHTGTTPPSACCKCHCWRGPVH